MSSSTDNKMEKDLEIILNFIENHKKSQRIKDLFRDNNDRYYIWTTWHPSKLQTWGIIRNKVIELGWESSSFGFMMRALEKELTNTSQRSKP